VLVGGLQAPPKVPPASEAAAPKKPWRNPFLPYEEELHVRALPPHHELLLNKFNVVDHHLLVRVSHGTERRSKRGKSEP
jgi:ATP adenylyltransferase/5',5'''-P-1,P-4-tetraphosphate phosphorylase II